MHNVLLIYELPTHIPFFISPFQSQPLLQQCIWWCGGNGSSFGLLWCKNCSYLAQRSPSQERQIWCCRCLQWWRWCICISGREIVIVDDSMIVVRIFILSINQYTLDQNWLTTILNEPSSALYKFSFPLFFTFPPLFFTLSIFFFSLCLMK